MSDNQIEYQRRQFVEFYLALGFNASEAYKKLYPTRVFAYPEYLNSAASTYLAHEKVQQYLRERLEQRKKELHVDQNYVMRKNLEIVEADYTSSVQYLSKNQLESLPEGVRKLIKSVEIDKRTHKWSERFGKDDHEEETIKYKVTFMDKDRALESLAKHTGFHAKDNVNVNIEAKSWTDALKELDV